MEAIIAAIISAAASVIAALIGRKRPAKPTSLKAPVAPQVRRRRSGGWLLVLLILLFWTVLASQLLTRGELLEINFLALIPAVTIAAAYMCAPTPLAAASGVLAIHAVNAGLMAVSHVHGFMIGSGNDLLVLLLASALNAMLAAIAVFWSKRQQGN